MLTNDVVSFEQPGPDRFSFPFLFILNCYICSLQHEVTCAIQNIRSANSIVNNNLRDWFYLNPYNCLLTLSQSLTTIGVSQVEMDIQGTDNGFPPRSATTIARVTINIFRNQNDPFFVATPYVTTIPETTVVGSNVLTVSARDQDDFVSTFWINFS